MLTKTARHVGRYRPLRDVVLALAGAGAGRHRLVPLPEKLQAFDALAATR